MYWTTSTYSGPTGGSFKNRWRTHKTNLKHESYKNSTKLSTYFHTSGV